MQLKHKQIKSVEAKKIIINRFTGELVDSIPEGSKPGEYREQLDFSDCPSQTDQSQIHENNITKLMEKYAPDELAAYLAAKNHQRPEINNHDFAEEPELMYAMNTAYQIQSEFDKLPNHIKLLFRGKPAEFLKFCENPKNKKQLLAWGIAKEADQALNAIKRDEASPPAQQDPKA